jgi:NAD(P) transhydrogenase subunit alpha
MKLGVLQERRPGETRVALVPAQVPLAANPKTGLEVLVEPGAGLHAGFSDAEYAEKGATIAADRAQVLAQADVLLCVRLPEDSETLVALNGSKTLIGMADPLGNPQLIADLAGRGLRVFALELIPRITRAQNMDVLSSMATVSGYKAVLLAANHLTRMFPMLMTAAGTIPPAKVLVLGAGVAGLQALATARRLGAVTMGYDVRIAAREQVESLGAKFVELDLKADDAEGAGGYAKQLDQSFYDRQRQLLGRVIAECDVVISTAAVPGSKSPLLIDEAAVQGMKSGSVIVDLAAERGGNCALTIPDRTIQAHGITILGPTNLPASVPTHASQLYSRNLVNFITHLSKLGLLGGNSTETDDQIARETLACDRGEVQSVPVRHKLGLPVKTPEAVGS